MCCGLLLMAGTSFHHRPNQRHETHNRPLAVPYTTTRSSLPNSSVLTFTFLSTSISGSQTHNQTNQTIPIPSLAIVPHINHAPFPALPIHPPSRISRPPRPPLHHNHLPQSHNTHLHQRPLHVRLRPAPIRPRRGRYTRRLTSTPLHRAHQTRHRLQHDLRHPQHGRPPSSPSSSGRTANA